MPALHRLAHGKFGMLNSSAGRNLSMEIPIDNSQPAIQVQPEGAASENIFNFATGDNIKGDKPFTELNNLRLTNYEMVLS
jgi:hypothetical protein